MSLFVNTVLCCTFFSILCFNAQSQDTMTNIEKKIKDGAPSNEIRKELDVLDISSLSTNEQQKYYKLSASINMRMKSTEKANNDLLQLLKMSLNDNERKIAVNMFARNMRALNSTHGINDIYDKIKKEIPDIHDCEIWFGLFYCLYQRDDKNFVSIANDIVEKTDKASQAYIRYVMAMYLCGKQEYNQTVKICTALLTNGSKIFSEKESLDIQFLLAYSLAHNNEIDAAIVVFTKLLECNDTKIKAKSYLGLGYCFAEKHEYEKAIMNYEKAKEKSSNFGPEISEEANRAIGKIKKLHKNKI